jgi:hypothetical protein
MHPPHVARVLASIRPGDVVLDIGGWACPFNAATHILDSSPYETRGYYAKVGGLPFQGPERESFTKATWIQRDICDREPYPFADKSVDFVICSHTLEDVRDPIWVCSEMRRIAKRGYVETPSRMAESSRGWESPKIVGLTHHRWLVEVSGNRVSFTHKPHAIHKHWRYALPASYFRELTDEQRVTWLFWEGTFDAVETTPIDTVPELERGLAAYVQGVHPYPRWKIATSEAVERARGLAERAYGGVRRRLAKAR